jgi:hypothetical protein
VKDQRTGWETPFGQAINPKQVFGIIDFNSSSSTASRVSPSRSAVPVKGREAGGTQRNMVDSHGRFRQRKETQQRITRHIDELRELTSN